MCVHYKEVDYTSYAVTVLVAFKASSLNVAIQCIKVVLKADNIDEGSNSLNAITSSIHGIACVHFSLNWIPFDPHILPLPTRLPHAALLPASIP